MPDQTPPSKSFVLWVRRLLEGDFARASGATPPHTFQHWARLLGQWCQCGHTECICDIGFLAGVVADIPDIQDSHDRLEAVGEARGLLWEFVIENGGRTEEEEMAAAVAYDEALRALGADLDDDGFPEPH